MCDFECAGSGGSAVSGSGGGGGSSSAGGMGSGGKQPGISLNPPEYAYQWHRDVDAPVFSIGAKGDFDEQHLFAPVTVREGSEIRLYYAGSRSGPRVYRLGLATSSDDGRTFIKKGVVFEAPASLSVVTAAILRGDNGEVERENGKLRMWFAAADLTGGGFDPSIYESSSSDGIKWSSPSPAQFDKAYAPTVLREPDGYVMWYADVSENSWVIRRAVSKDGKAWTKDAEPTLQVNGGWEKWRIIYPHVVRRGGQYYMWYAAYLVANAPHKVGIGLAVSKDGLSWKRHPDLNLRPDPERSWESGYVSTPAVLPQKDGSWRLWYATRSFSNYAHKYFGIGTARAKALPTF